MASRKRAAADLTGIRGRGNRYQVRIFGGVDRAPGKQLILTGSAATESDAIALRDGFRKQTQRDGTSPSSCDGWAAAAS